LKTIDFEGKTILVAGGGAGIGCDTSLLLSRFGAHIVITDIDENAGQSAMEQLEGTGHRFYAFDIGNLNLIGNLVNRIVADSGKIDGLVYAVGIRSRRPISLLTPELFLNLLSVNVVGFVELIRSITRKNNFNEGLSIVGISSIAALRGSPGVTSYAASKAAMDSSVRCLARELASKKIRINSVMPAQIDTAAFRELQEMSAENVDHTLSRQYLGLGRSMDVANIIAFLLSSSSSLITGSTIPADGGFLST
jgi:NAD(P)-dependent dehydrogenase (short-subunit alcohol dehydrogenase family)